MSTTKTALGLIGLVLLLVASIFCLVSTLSATPLQMPALDQAMVDESFPLMLTDQAMETVGQAHTGDIFWIHAYNHDRTWVLVGYEDTELGWLPARILTVLEDPWYPPLP